MGVLRCGNNYLSLELSREHGSKYRGRGAGEVGVVWEVKRRVESRNLRVTGTVNEAKDGTTKKG